MKLITLAAAATIAAGAHAQTWTEVGDALDLLPGQMTSGTGPLLSIFGAFSGATDADIYCIEIFAPSVFSATTTNAITGTLDTQIFLFDIAGNPIAMNDDNPLGGTFTSALPLGNALYAGLTPGEYLIAVSQYDWDPLNGAGVAMFPDSPFAGVHGPINPGPLAGWGPTAFGLAGAYEITLTGASYCMVPEPATFVALGAALFGLAALRRRK